MTLTNKKSARIKKKREEYSIRNDFKRNYELYLLFLPVLIYYIIFCYWPMYGAVIAFKDFRPGLGILGSPWVGFQHFMDFFTSVNFKTLLFNTLTISTSSLLFSFPAAIILALLINELRFSKFASAVKTVTYLPHFVSLVVICSMVKTFVSDDGLVGSLVNSITGERTSMLSNPKYFVPIYVISDIWQNVGWNSIIYLAALSAVDQELYEAAKIDGAGRWAQTFHITLPSIMNTIILLFIMKMGHVLSLGHEKIILLYNPMIMDTADVISTYVYRKGLQEFDYSFSTAVGLFNSVVGFILVMTTNAISKKVNDISLF